MSNIRYLTQSHLAELTGKDRATVRKRLEGLEPHSQDGRAKYFDAHVALPMILLIENTAGIDRQLQEEKLRYETARADRMELEVSKRKGELVEVESIGQAVEKEYTSIRAGFLALGVKLAAPLALECTPAHVKLTIDTAVNEVLGELLLDKKYLELEHADELREEILQEPSERIEDETDT